MDHAGRGHAGNAPTCGAQPFLPVYFLAVHKIAFVKQADLANGLAPHHQRGTSDEVHKKGPAHAKQFLAVTAVQPEIQDRQVQPARRSIEVEGDLREAGKAKCTMLKTLVGVWELGPTIACARVAVQKGHHLCQCIALNDRIRVEQQHVSGRRIGRIWVEKPVIRRASRFVAASVETPWLKGEVVGAGKAQVAWLAISRTAGRSRPTDSALPSAEALSTTHT